MTYLGQGGVQLPANFVGEETWEANAPQLQGTGAGQWLTPQDTDEVSTKEDGQLTFREETYTENQQSSTRGADIQRSVDRVSLLGYIQDVTM